MTAAKPGGGRSRVRRNAIAIAAHDLRTPLDVVIGMTRLLLDTGLDEEQLDHASTILSSAESAVAVLDDLADRASIESGGFALAAASFSPRQILDECARLVMPQAAEKRVAAEYGVDPAVPPSLVGDGARLRRVVFRLLAGIVGASSDGRMDVGMTTRARPGGEIELRVSVRCSAMDSVDRRDLMGGGTHAAPGPSVAEFIVRRMKGRVRVTAGRGGGARVDLSVVVRSERAAGGGDAGSDLPERALRVLVVDDDALSRKAAVRALRRSRWHADSVADGDAALGALLRDAYDLVLLDMHLARSNGRDVAREIRRRVPAGGPRIVAMTAAPESGDGAAWTAAGLDACVAKPVDADRIRRALRGLPATAEHDVRSPTDIDAAVLDRYRAGRGKARSPLLAELIDDYAADIPGQLDRLREDAARPDAAALRETAHRVAGTSASIGAVGIASLASSMERLAADGDVGGAAAVLERLVAAWPVVRAALVRERGRR